MAVVISTFVMDLYERPNRTPKFGGTLGRGQMRERPNRTKTFLKASGLIIGLTVGITVATAPAAAGGRIIYDNERHDTYKGHGKKHAYKKGFKHGYHKGQKHAYRDGHGHGKRIKKHAYKHGYKKGYKHGHQDAYKHKPRHGHGHGYKYGKPIYNFVFGFPGHGSWARHGYKPHKRVRHYRHNRCHPVSRIGYDRYGRKVKFGGTMCYDRYGASYIVRGSRHIIHYY